MLVEVMTDPGNYRVGAKYNFVLLLHMSISAAVVHPATCLKDALLERVCPCAKMHLVSLGKSRRIFWVSRPGTQRSPVDIFCIGIDPMA